MSEPILRIEAVTKRFASFVAVDEFSLDVHEGELVTLLGPSGCGKTTLLRIIAGFEQQTSGTIELVGKDLQGVPPHQRPVNMVFQRYALFPHLSVFENIAFGLRLKRLEEKEINERVQAMLDLVGLPDFGPRKTTQLSGGESQRVALARAVVMDPQVLLLDEPLGALDLKIRQQMQSELKRIHSELGATFLYVTHDQGEAMTISDRIVVMNRGRIIQVGTASEIYQAPSNAFCASFVGESNLLSGEVFESSPTATVVSLSGELIRGQSRRTTQRGQQVKVLIRPEAVSVIDAAQADKFENVLEGTVIDSTFLGSTIRYRLDIGTGQPLDAVEQAKGEHRVLLKGESVLVGWSRLDCLILAE